MPIYTNANTFYYFLMKIRKNAVIIIVAAVLLVIATITAIFVINHVKAVRLEKEMHEKPIKIAFYNVDTKAQEAIKKVVAEEWSDLSSGFEYEFAYLDSSKPADDYLFDDFTIGLLFSDSYTSETVQNLAVKPAETVYSSMPIAVRSITRSAIPIVLDDFEVLYNIKALSANKTSPSPLLDDMLSFAKAAGNGKRFTIGCAGKDDKTLGMLIASCMESFYSDASLEKLWKAIQNAEKSSDTSNIFDLVVNAAGNENFKATLDTLCEWKKNGLFHSEWYAMTQQEVEYLMETELFSVVFMPLSVHRTVSFRTIEKYTENFFPAGRVEGASGSRSLIFSILTGTVIKNRFEDKSEVCMQLLTRLTNLQNQATIADATGLAPVSSTAETPDKQASNARLWAAASDKPLHGLNDAFSKPEAKTAFFNGLREYLRFN